MDRNMLSGKNFQSLINFLWDNGALDYFSLEDCELGQEGGEAIAVGMTKNRGISELHIGKNRFGDVAMEGLVRALLENARLRVLDIDGCKIMDRGGKALSELIRNNHGIHTYDFRDNQFYDETGSHMADAIKQNHRVKKI
mmetsp:Transcript_32502/g.29347  ORF Transcript_32502/g.29347 Transcript_32502/m.29347 type:complete len:140 (+) Transcript_32502:1528-1947(+)